METPPSIPPYSLVHYILVAFQTDDDDDDDDDDDYSDYFDHHHHVIIHSIHYSSYPAPEPARGR